MKILGLGLPELMILLVYPLLIALFVAIVYLVVKKAVKKAIIEAHDEIALRGTIKTGDGIEVPGRQA